jgi:hypothetical protein
MRIYLIISGKQFSILRSLCLRSTGRNDDAQIHASGIASFHKYTVS